MNYNISKTTNVGFIFFIVLCINFLFKLKNSLMFALSSTFVVFIGLFVLYVIVGASVLVSKIFSKNIIKYVKIDYMCPCGINDAYENKKTCCLQWVEKVRIMMIAMFSIILTYQVFIILSLNIFFFELAFESILAMYFFLSLVSFGVITLVFSFYKFAIIKNIDLVGFEEFYQNELMNVMNISFIGFMCCILVELPMWMLVSLNPTNFLNLVGKYMKYFVYDSLFFSK